ncbi:MAG TPA: META domain-containing protein [Usitatibacter sp.]|jgi:heat shock protein HslJ|nr:META domain-containing protein [Usitatibacter sp.]
MRRLLPVVLAALAVGACAAVPAGGGGAAEPSAQPSGQAAPSLAGTRWTGVVEGTPDPRILPRLEFTPGRVAGFTGCNMLSGTWRVENGELHVGPLATTKRMCLGPAGDIEKRFLAALGAASRVTREGDRLVFTAPGGARFEFTEAAAG